MSDTTTYGEIAYDAYCESVGGKAYNGEPLPAFKDIAKESVRRGWEAAAGAVAEALVARAGMQVRAHEQETFLK